MKTKHNLVLIGVFTSLLIVVLITQPVKSTPTYMGEWASDNRVEINVHSFSTMPSASYHPYDPSEAGYVYACADVSIKNVGSQSIDTNQLFAYLKDTENYLYSSEIVLSPKRMPLIELAPGDTLRGEIYWEIPEDSTISQFVWQDFTSDIHVTIPEFPSPMIIIALAFFSSIVLVKWKPPQNRISTNRF